MLGQRTLRGSTGRAWSGASAYGAFVRFPPSSAHQARNRRLEGRSTSSSDCHAAARFARASPDSRASSAIRRSVAASERRASSPARSGQTNANTSVITTTPSTIPTNRSRNSVRSALGPESLQRRKIVRKGKLGAEIGGALAAHRDPRSRGRDRSDEERKRGDRRHLGDDEDDRDEGEASADRAPCEAQGGLVDRRACAAKRDDHTGDHARVDPVPIDGCIEDVAEHRRERDLDGELHVRRGWSARRREEAARGSSTAGRSANGSSRTTRSIIDDRRCAEREVSGPLVPAGRPEMPPSIEATTAARSARTPRQDCAPAPALAETGRRRPPQGAPRIRPGASAS